YVHPLRLALLLLRPPLGAALVPYTTLFRSGRVRPGVVVGGHADGEVGVIDHVHVSVVGVVAARRVRGRGVGDRARAGEQRRRASERVSRGEDEGDVVASYGAAGGDAGAHAV